MGEESAIEAILQLVVGDAGGTRFHLAANEPAFRCMSGRGATIGTTDPLAGWDESHMDATEQERTPVEIDVRRVLQEGVAPWGYSVAFDGEDCLLLSHAKLPPAKCSVAVPLRADLGAIALRARSTASLLLRIHFGEETAPALLNVERALGVVPVRLRDLKDLDVEGILAAAGISAVAASAFGISATTPAPALVTDVRPEQVADYANTADASRFESATAQILDGFMDIVLPLGARLTGKPVPDGVVVLEARVGEKTKVAIYDCKSREDAKKYSFDPKDGDQFARYGEILQRCEDEGWQAQGILVATSDADAVKLGERMTKDIWSRLKARKFIVVPAAVLNRWNQLSAAEGPAFRGRVDAAAAWRALWDQQLPEGISDERLARYFKARDLPYRVLSVAEGEVIWLAGATPVKPTVATAFAHLQRASIDDRIDAHKKPRLVDRVIALLGATKNLTLADIARETGLSQLAVEYLLDGKALGELPLDDIGQHFVSNRSALRSALGLKS